MSYVNSVFVAGRGAGKTHQMIEWLLRGHPIEGDPTWSRMILCSDSARAWDIMRRMRTHRSYLAACQRNPDLPMRVRHAIRSVDRTVLDGIDPRVELGVDDVETVLQTLLRTTLPFRFLTVNGSLHPVTRPSWHAALEEEEVS